MELVLARMARERRERVELGVEDAVADGARLEALELFVHVL